jgi:hypothetical protein
MASPAKSGITVNQPPNLRRYHRDQIIAWNSFLSDLVDLLFIPCPLVVHARFSICTARFLIYFPIASPFVIQLSAIVYLRRYDRRRSSRLSLSFLALTITALHNAHAELNFILSPSQFLSWEIAI